MTLPGPERGRPHVRRRIRFNSLLLGNSTLTVIFEKPFVSQYGRFGIAPIRGWRPSHRMYCTLPADNVIVVVKRLSEVVARLVVGVNQLPLRLPVQV